MRLFKHKKETELPALFTDRRFEGWDDGVRSELAQLCFELRVLPEPLAAPFFEAAQRLTGALPAARNTVAIAGGFDLNPYFEMLDPLRAAVLVANPSDVDATRIESSLTIGEGVLMFETHDSNQPSVFCVAKVEGRSTSLGPGGTFWTQMFAGRRNVELVKQLQRTPAYDSHGLPTVPR